MKKLLVFSLFILFLTACGSAGQTAVATKADAILPTNTAAALPTTIPSKTPTEASSTMVTVAPTSTPTSVDAASASPATPSPQQNCIDKAAFSEDVTIPDGTLIQLGDSFTKTWRIQNAGTCTWTGYQLVDAGGEAMNGKVSNPMPEIKPGDYGNVSVDLQAPQRGGAYTGYWHFLNSAGQPFGVGAEDDGLLWVQINVSFSQASAAPTQPAPATSPSSMVTLQTGTGSCVYSRNPDYEAQILALINNVRTQNGLAALTSDDKLNAAALVHSMDMACNGIISHTGTDGSTWYDRVKAQGFPNYNSDRENIYVGDPAVGGDAQGAFNWWMNSDIHRRTLMNPDQRLIGIAYVYSKNSAYGGNYTTEFARP